MTVTVLAPYLKQRWVDGNGNPLYLGTINTYAAGTLTPIATYKDSIGTANTNPIVLNARGECDLWLLPNTSYKFIVADSAGNLIPGGTIDNVINSQLLSLYGGVDSGGPNAYVLTFAASFAGYTDGILINWFPSNTNTGASTINVNSIGIVNIVNVDGNPLIAGQLVANQSATIQYKGGVFQLISYPLIAGTTTISWTGFSAAPSTTITYRANQNMVSLTMPISGGTSNSAFFVLNGLPAFLRPSITQNIPCVGLVDNGTNLAGGAAQVSPSGTVSFFKDGSFGNWTATGAKGFSVNLTLTYSR